MIIILFFLALLGSSEVTGNVALPFEGTGQNDTESASGSRCVCDAFFTTSIFPSGNLVVVEQTVVEISHKLELKMGKIEDHEIKLSEYAEKITNLKVEIEKVEKNSDNSEVVLNDIKIQIKQIEALIAELKHSINGSTTFFKSLRVEIATLGETLDDLEKTHDKNLVLTTRREYYKLQAQLEECERRHQELFSPNIGSCAHNGITEVGQPFVSHLNANLNSGYKFGGWGKDSKPLPVRESMYWYAGYTSQRIIGIYLYAAYNNLILRQPFGHYNLQWNWYGTGNNFIIHANTLYYQPTNPFGIAKLNFTTMRYESRVIAKASRKFSYSNSPDQIFDFSADETGLWVTFATEESSGRIVIAKINEKSFGVEKEWQTNAYKPRVSNSFMVCGVFYAVRTDDIQTEEIFYKYDTSTKQESYISIPFERFQDKFSNLHYNPTDQKLYMYNDGYYVSYHLWFNHTAKATMKPPTFLQT